MAATTKDLKSILSKLTHSDGAKVVEQIGEQTKQLQARMVGIRRKLAILSGKGGVGKSMTTVNLALAFARQDQQVAILDVDLNGPCVPHMLGIRGQQLTMTPEGALPPVGPLGIKVGSMDFFLGDLSPVRWNRPMDLSPVWLGTLEMTVIREFLADIVWGEVDYLLIDLPPGAAADKPPVIASFIPDLDGAVVVTTPSEMAMDVVRKSVIYARSLNIKILGLIENMSEYRCPECGTESELFESQADEMCDALEIPFLGRIPFDRDLARSFDKGKPLLDPAHPTIAKYAEISGRIRDVLDFNKLLAEKL
ncbi:MAG TPA: ATP-binding protein [Nitrospirales bacterium]|nr:ATP-binding protein [Nitrospirales bacterium]HIN32765.1 ATP-binding protein [Nitrospirales bacterium]